MAFAGADNNSSATPDIAMRAQDFDLLFLTSIVELMPLPRIAARGSAGLYANGNRPQSNIASGADLTTFAAPIRLLVFWRIAKLIRLTV